MENKTSFHKFMDATGNVKVEFALADKAKTIAAKSESIAKELSDLQSELNKVMFIVDKAVAKIKEADKMYNDGKSVGYEMGGALENLGVQPRSNADYNKLWDALNLMQDRMSAVQFAVKKYS